ncbi:hypothetical protein ACB092_01G223500 [Castanea dentata]
MIIYATKYYTKYRAAVTIQFGMTRGHACQCLYIENFMSKFSESCQVGLVTNSFILQVGFPGLLYNVYLTLGIYLKWLRVLHPLLMYSFFSWTMSLCLWSSYISRFSI